MPSARHRQANNALGICLIALMFLGESVVAHQSHPSPASPYLWALAGGVAVAALLFYLRHRSR